MCLDKSKAIIKKLVDGFQVSIKEIVTLNSLNNKEVGPCHGLCVSVPITRFTGSINMHSHV